MHGHRGGKKLKKGEGCWCFFRMWVNASILRPVKSRRHRQEGECNAYITYLIVSVKSAPDIVLT